MNTHTEQMLQVLTRCHARVELGDDAELLAFERAVTAIEDSSLGTASSRQLRSQAKPDDIDRIRERLAILLDPQGPAATQSASGTAALGRPEPADGTQAGDGEGEAQTPAYEMVLGPAAIRTVLTLRNLDDRKGLAAALRAELVDEPKPSKELTAGANGNTHAYVDPGVPSGSVYVATPLSFNGYTALHRPLTGEELKRLRREQDRLVADRGLYVVDILPIESVSGHPQTT